MDLNWSTLDGVLGVILVIVIIWAALKLVTRLVVGAIIVVVLALAFFGLHLNEFNFGG
jgi:hypothetical protein